MLALQRRNQRNLRSLLVARRALVVAALSAVYGCAGAPEAHKGRPYWACAQKSLEYTAVSPLGVSAADLVRRFGSERAAGSVSIAFAYEQGVVSFTTCPKMPPYLGFPVAARFRESDSPPRAFGARVTAYRADELALTGELATSNGAVPLGVWLRGDGVDVMLGAPNEPSAKHWSKPRTEAAEP